MAQSVKLPDQEPMEAFKDWTINATAMVVLEAECDGMTEAQAKERGVSFMQAVTGMMAERLWRRFNDLPVEPWPERIRF